MFHAKEGWFFERVDNGDVRIMLIPAGFGGQPQQKVQLSSDTWASIVATVSAKGETSESWRAAKDFHDLK